MSRRIFILAEVVDAHEAGKILNVSARTVTRYCETRLFRTARKSGIGRTSPWKIDRDEILANQPQLKETQHV